MVDRAAISSAASPWTVVDASASSRGPSPGLRAALPGLIVLSVVATFSWWRGRPVAAFVAAGAAFVLLQVSVVWPSVAHRVVRTVERVGHAIGAGLSVLVLWITWLTVVVPVALLNRLVRIDLLDTGTGGWQAAGPVEGRQRPYRREPRLTGHRGRRALRLAPLVLVIGAITVGVVDRATTVPPPPVTPFGARSTAEPTGEVFEDHWVTYRDVPVSRRMFPGEPWGADLLSIQEDAAPCDAINSERDLKRTNGDFSSAYVNVVDGVRRTFAVREPDRTIWLFGGSTTYGIGQRDEYTIPSQLVRLAAERGEQWEVLNLGCPGKVNWTETAEFEAMLRAGEPVPDAAVFLDGINEWNVSFTREIYGLLDSDVPFRGLSTEAEREALAAFARARGYEETHDQERQAELAAGQYRAGVELARTVGDEFDVPVVHFWQPALFTMPLEAPGNLTVVTNDEVDPAGTIEAGEHYRTAAARSGVDPIDLMDIFDDATQPLYFDCCHTNEEGARLEAEAMYPYIAAVLGP